MSEETDNRRVLLDQSSCTNVLQILLRKDLVSLKPTTQRGQRSDPESIRASCSPQWTSSGMVPALLRSEAVQWPVAKKSLCSALWANQTPELNLCTSSVLSSLIFSSATWRHQLKSCSLPRQANKCSFVSDYCLVVFVYFLLMVLTKVGTWYRISLEYNTCLCFVNKFFIHCSILRTWSLFPTTDQIHALHLKCVPCRLVFWTLGLSIHSEVVWK